MNKINFDKGSYLPANDDIHEVENIINSKLPLDYKLFMSTYNDFIPSDQIAYCYDIEWKKNINPVLQGIVSEWFPIYPGKIIINHGNENPPSNLPTIFDALNNYCDIDYPRVPVDTIPIGSAGDGDKILLGISQHNYNKIFYWVMNLEEEYEDIGMLPSYDNIGFIAHSFTEFLESLYPCKESKMTF
jgi:hypothetical protein